MRSFARPQDGNVWFAMPRCLILAVLSGGACSGSIDDPAPATISGTIDGRPQGGAGGGSPTGGPNPTTPPPGQGQGGGGTCTSFRLGASAPLRRLTTLEYTRTIRDLLGVALEASALPSDLPPLAGFTNNADTLGLSPNHVRGYLEGAEKAADAVFSNQARRDALVGCQPTGTEREACLRSFVTAFGRRAFRRPVTATEQQALLAVAKGAPASADPHLGARWALEAMLQAPQFLFRVERGRPVPSGGRTLDGYERATRLSYFLLGTTPDDTLLAAAESGALDRPEGLAAAAQKLIDDPRGRESMRSFFAEWFGASLLPNVARSSKEFPLWNAALTRAMAEEQARVVDEMAYGPGRSFLDLVKGRRTVVNAPLAKLYGVAGPSGETWSAAELPAVRSGVLTGAAFLTAFSGHDNTPILRAKAIRERFLCETLPLPPDVPPLPEPEKGKTTTLRERLEQHRSDPACVGCHQLLDPLGFGLSRFDEIGAYHDREADGQLISEAGSLAGAPDPNFTGAVELGEKIAAMPAFTSCVPRQVLSYALGRSLTDEDRCELDRLGQRFAASRGSWPQLLLAIVQGPAFTTVFDADAAADPAKGARP